MVTAVTGFYDVAGPAITIATSTSISWLNQTLQTPLPLLVFLDPAFDASCVVLKPEDRIVRVVKK